MRRFLMSVFNVVGHAVGLVLFIVAIGIIPLLAQTDSGTVSGRVVDPSGSVIVGARVRLVDIDRNTVGETVTNSAGLYTFHGVHPGRYRMEITAKGFKVVNVTGLTVNTQANLEQNFALSIGSVTEHLTVEAKAADISTSVSTVVDRQFVQNIPLNGRSFQTLFQLTPGVVVTPTSNTDSGQFSVNGQRASANYFMVDGVSANIGASSNLFSTQSASGTTPGLSVLGGTNNLVSMDALQEFRIQTSTYAPEFGRTPGAQVSLETRSGTNQFHGTVFEYLRNDALDASNWFNGTSNPPLKKSQEHQNDFGGVVGGPIFKNKTFFFFSYEGLIARLPRTVTAKVPSLAVRQDPATSAVILPVLNAYPLPNGPQSASDALLGIAPFSASFFDPATLKATSIRIDHKVSDRLSVFGRYNFSPSELLARGNGVALANSEVDRLNVTTETLTLGTMWFPTTNIASDFRFNYSRNRARDGQIVDSFRGAVAPASSLFLPSPFTTESSAGAIAILSIGPLRVGRVANELQRQINLVDTFSLQTGHHAVKLGVDFRRLSPNVAAAGYGQTVLFLGVQSAALSQPFAAAASVVNPVTILFHNVGAYAQDTWRMTPRLSLTYGLRWDVDFAPSTAHGPDFPAFTTGDPNTLALAPVGTSVFKTRYNNFAPRVGLAYRLSAAKEYESVLRGGFGVFYDLATSQTADLFEKNPQPPFGATSQCIVICNGMVLTFPVTASELPPPSIDSNPRDLLAGFDPDLKLPYSLQWNIALEQSLGNKQVLTVSYLGAVGRRLTQEENGAFQSGSGNFLIIGNHATSDYHALQFQFHRQMSRGLQALASYTWSHSIDDASSSTLRVQNTFAPELGAGANRAASDFDVRHSFSAGISYRLTSPFSNLLLKTLTSGWSFDNLVQGRSATPVDVVVFGLSQFGLSTVAIRPDLVPGEPLYLQGAACGAICPGGKALNPAAFMTPSSLPGNLPRNALRGFGAFQWDSAVSRTFALKEGLHLQFRAEFFNLLNHPNFANPVSLFGTAQFGRSIQTLNQGLNGASTLGGGGFNPLYQLGGPRSGQLAFKLSF